MSQEHEHNGVSRPRTEQTPEAWIIECLDLYGDTGLERIETEEFLSHGLAKAAS